MRNVVPGAAQSATVTCHVHGSTKLGHEWWWCCNGGRGGRDGRDGGSGGGGGSGGSGIVVTQKSNDGVQTLIQI